MSLDRLVLRLAYAIIILIAVLLACFGAFSVALEPHAVQSGPIRCTRFYVYTVCVNAPPDATPRFWEDITDDR